MSDMQDQINEAIKANLPQATGELLRKELFELETRRSKDVANKAASDKLLADLKDAKDAHTSAMTALNKHAGLTEREAKVLEREREQNLRDFKVQSADERRAEILGLVNTVFRSPVFTQSITGSVPVVRNGGTYNNGNGTSIAPDMVDIQPVSKQVTVSQV